MVVWGFRVNQGSDRIGDFAHVNTATGLTTAYANASLLMINDEGSEGGSVFFFL